MTGTSMLLMRRLLALTLMVLACLLLAVLLVLSGSPHQNVVRNLDQRLDYLSSAVNRLTQRLATTQAPNSSQLELLSEGVTSVVPGVKTDLDLVFNQQNSIDETRQWLVSQLGAVRRLATADPVVMQTLGDTLGVEWDALSGSIDKVAATQSAARAASSALAEQTRTLVSSLRLRGNAELAGQLYDSEGSLRAALELDLETLAKRSGPAFTAGNLSLPAADRRALGALNEEARTLIAARSQLAGTLGRLDFTQLQNTVRELRERLTADTLARLAVVNEARILLNMYTLLLLGVLAYFGFRLARSYQALNRSHEDLEARVHERTEDLEVALSDLKESQSQLVQAEKMSSLGQLVAGVMHEINTPLLYVQNNTSITAEMATELNDFVAVASPLLRATNMREAQTELAELYRSRERFDPNQLCTTAGDMTELTRDSVDGLNQISELVQSLKDFSRLDRAAEDLFDVREGLDRTLTITRNLMKTGVEVVKKFGDVPQVRCSPSQLNQVFINLITNAIQAMDGVGTLTLRTSASDDWVEVSVEDTGCGIAQEHLDQIMDPFFTTKPVGQGTGLGLSIVHKIVHDHGGQIQVDSKPGHGTRITVGFPSAERAANEPDLPSAEADSAHDAFPVNGRAAANDPGAGASAGKSTGNGDGEEAA